MTTKIITCKMYLNSDTYYNSYNSYRGTAKFATCTGHAYTNSLEVLVHLATVK